MGSLEQSGISLEKLQYRNVFGVSFIIWEWLLEHSFSKDL
jgi:hypothetical protein